MPNLNYRAGARVEYGRRKHWLKRGYEVVRSAGSHGIWDLCCVHRENPGWPVELIQVKRVETQAQAKTLINRFRTNPSLKPSPHYHQVLEVQVKGSRDVLSVTI